MDRETRVGFIFMFVMVSCAVGLPILLKMSLGW